MKKQLFSLFTALVVNIALSQTIPNGGFENWTTTSYEDPLFWICSNDNSNNGNYAPPNALKTTDSYHGNYAIKLTTILNGTDTIGAYFADGNPGSSTMQGGIPYNQKPMGIRLYYKCNIMPGDSAIILAIFKKSGATIGQYIYKIPTSQASYTLFNQTFSPALPMNPDTVIFACGAGNLIVNKGIPGTMLQVDSVSFTGVASQPASFNGDFELWQPVSRESLIGWNSNNPIKTTDKYSGTYALELVTNPPGFGDNQPQVGSISNANNHNSGPPTGGSPYSTQIDTLVFYYKYIPANYPLSTDSAQFNMSFSKNGSWVWGSSLYLLYSANYKKVQIPFNLSQIPDTVQISISSSKWPTLNSYIGSDLKVDQIYFKSQKVPVANFNLPATGCKGVPIQLTDNSANMPTSWSWITTGATQNNYSVQNPIITYTSNSTPHTYTISLQVADSFGVSAFISKTITINANPSVSASAPSLCLNSTATVTASGANTYTWNTGATTPSILVSPTVSTTYSVTGTDVHGCKDSTTSVVSVIQPQIPSICEVTTDSVTNYKYNYIYWDASLYTKVDSFIVYRYDAGSGNYLRIGAVGKDSLSVFIDKDSVAGGPHGGNPNYNAWKYKLAIKDSCGNIGQMGPYHQTMFVQQTGSNFSWTAYVDSGMTSFPTGYAFYRDNIGSGNFQLLTNVATTAASDPNYASYPNAVYRVDALGFNCNPNVVQRLSGNNSVLAAKVKSHSNTNNNRGMTTGANRLLSSNKADIYPNPAVNNVTISFASPVNKVSVKVISLLGNEMFSQVYNQVNANIVLDLNKYESGAYLIQITTDNLSEIKRIVKQ